MIELSSELRTQLAHMIGMATREVVGVVVRDDEVEIYLHDASMVSVPRSAVDLSAPEVDEPVVEADPEPEPVKPAAKPRPVRKKAS